MVPKPRNDTAFSGRISAVTQPEDPTAPVPAAALDAAAARTPAVVPAGQGPVRQREVGGPAGPEPTRYGDWELRGRCIDF
jgi:homeobox protein ESX1